MPNPRIQKHTITNLPLLWPIETNTLSGFSGFDFYLALIKDENAFTQLVLGPAFLRYCVCVVWINCREYNHLLIIKVS